MATDSFGRLGLPADIAAGDLNQRGRTRRPHAASRATAEGGREGTWMGSPWPPARHTGQQGGRRTGQGLGRKGGRRREGTHPNAEGSNEL